MMAADLPQEAAGLVIMLDAAGRTIAQLERALALATADGEQLRADLDAARVPPPTP